MGETDYGKCGNVSVKWEFSKIPLSSLSKRCCCISPDLLRIVAMKNRL